MDDSRARCACLPIYDNGERIISFQRWLYALAYTWDAVTSVNLNVSVVKNLTTPSCVYDRLFTRTRMAHFNALIVWKTLIDIYFSKKSSLLGIVSCPYEIPKNDLVDDMKLWPPVTSPDVYCYLIETLGDFTWKKLKVYNFVISVWV